MISIYPLIVLTMVNNLYIVVFGKDSAEASKTWKTFFFLLVMKFTAALLPIIVALAVSNLVTVLKFTGLAGIFLAFFFPTLLEISSEWVCRKKFAHFLNKVTVLRQCTSYKKLPLRKAETRTCVVM